MAVPSQSSGIRSVNQRRSSAKNRRHQHLLDTGVRNSEADRQRKRWWFGLTAKLFIAAAVAMGIYVGITKLVARTILRNPQYNIAELKVATDGVLDPEDILEAANIHKGTNIFHVDLVRAQARVASIPQVEKVLVSRQLPSRVDIQVSERKPVAWIAPTSSTISRADITSAPTAWLIDTHCVLLRPKKLNPQDRYLPIIRNYTESVPIEGQEAAGEEIKAALDLLRAQQESSNTARFQIEEVDLAKHFGLVVTDRNGMQVLFGLDEMDRQLKRLDVYLQSLDQRTQKPQTINLLVQRNVPVTLAVNAVSTDLPAATPPAVAPSPTPGHPAPPKGKARSTTKTRGKDQPKEKTRPKARSPETSRPKPNTSKGQPFLDRTSNAPRALPVNVSH